MLALSETEAADAIAYYERIGARDVVLPPRVQWLLRLVRLTADWEKTLLSPAGVNAIAELQRQLRVEADGKWGPKTAAAYERAVAHRGAYTPPSKLHGRHLPQHSLELRAAAAEVCRWLQIPTLTADEFSALSEIVRRESEGWTGRPNYTADVVPAYQDLRVASGRYSDSANRSVWRAFAVDVQENNYRSKSSAVGIGQLLGRNYDVYCPVGRAGIGDSLAELAGMISYCIARYGGTSPAWQFYELDQCPADRRSYYSARALVIGCKPGEGY